MFDKLSNDLLYSLPVDLQFPDLAEMLHVSCNYSLIEPAMLAIRYQTLQFLYPSF